MANLDVAAVPRTAGRLEGKGAEPMGVEKPRELQREGSSFQAHVLEQGHEKPGAATQGDWSEGQTEWQKSNTIQYYNTGHEFTGGAREAKNVNGEKRSLGLFTEKRVDEYVENTRRWGYNQPKKGGGVVVQQPGPDSISVLCFKQSKAARERGKKAERTSLDGCTWGSDLFSQLTPKPCWREGRGSHLHSMFLVTVWCTPVHQLYNAKTSQAAFWRPDYPFTAMSLFPFLTRASCPFVSCYWLCKRRTLHYSQLGRSAGRLLLLSQASGKAGVEEGFWWQGGQRVARREIKKPLSGR